MEQVPAPLTHDASSFLLGGRRLWLASGEMHYFRIPNGLWRDRLLKARQAGLNCIAVYVAWNFHEPREGEWLTSGDHDIARFLTIAADLGLYVILRPGPYICAEWDFGGLPAWLTTKRDIAYRTNNPAFMEAVERYLRRLLPPLAAHQVSRGGNVILIQNENEYYMSNVPGCGEYMQAINSLIRGAGFDVPIINCNRFSRTPADGTLECINTWGREIEDARRMRSRQPDAPLLVTEFWCGGFDCWGLAHRTTPAEEVARRALEILGAGAQVNYYMFHGGTNFEFWGSRMMGTEAFFQVTSYDYDAPLSEGGMPTRKYHLTRLVNTLATTMGRFFASAAPRLGGGDSVEGLRLLNLEGPDGGWCVVTNGGEDRITRARVAIDGGTVLDVPLHPFGGAAVPLGLRIAEDCLLDHANVTPFGLFGGGTLVLHGPPGWPVEVSINGRRMSGAIPSQGEPQVVRHEGLEIVLLPSELATRCWECREGLVFGPDWVGESLEDRRDAPDATTIHLLVPGSGEVRALSAIPPAVAPSPDALLEWDDAGTAEGPSTPEAGWSPLKGPADFDTLGNHYGYGWYRVAFEESVARTLGLYFPEMGDRLRLFHDGSPAGIWGRGPGATRQPLPLKTRAGLNVLHILADNLGRFSHGIHLMGERKGLFGHIRHAERLPLPSPTITSGHGCDPSLIPPEQHHRVFESASWPPMKDLPHHRVAFALDCGTRCDLHLTFRRIPNSVLVLLNGEPVSFLPTYAPVFGEILLPAAQLREGGNVLEFQLWGDLVLESLREIRLFALREAITANASWHWKAQPMQPGSQDSAPIPGAPAWYRARFSRKRPGPHYLDLAGCGKGQALLNGHNIGRYWDVGPQRTLYLPECWLDDENEVVLFVEDGRRPPRSRVLPHPLLDGGASGDAERSDFLTV